MMFTMFQYLIGSIFKYRVNHKNFLFSKAINKARIWRSRRLSLIKFTFFREKKKRSKTTKHENLKKHPTRYSNIPTLEEKKSIILINRLGADIPAYNLMTRINLIKSRLLIPTSEKITECNSYE